MLTLWRRLRTESMSVVADPYVADAASFAADAGSIRHVCRRLSPASVYPHLERLEQRCVLSRDPANYQLLVQFQPQVTDSDQAAVLSQVHGTISEVLQTQGMRDTGTRGLDVVQIIPGRSVRKALTLLNADPRVEYAEANLRLNNQVASKGSTANDPYFKNGSLWGMGAADSTPSSVYGSQAANAWAKGETGSPSVYVGVVDEGIDLHHPDLAANIWTNPFDPVDGKDNDGNGYVDDVHGWDFVHGDNTIYDRRDGEDHGTHVAGTIGAVGDNGSGVAGVNWRIGIISSKFIGKKGGLISNAVKALDYLTDLKTRNGINIVASNNSWVGGKFSQALQAAINRAAEADILFVAAAGNGNAKGRGLNNDVKPDFPANYDTSKSAGYDNVIVVAAIARNGSLAVFSNYGAKTVDLGAPGVDIWSTIPKGKYASYEGTSMAAPHVTGAIALYAAAHPGASAQQIKTAILNSARATPTAPLAGKTVTGGRLNIGLL